MRSAVESLLASNPPLIREAWIHMLGWYKDTSDRPPPPFRVTLGHMMEERVDLYRHIPYLGNPIPVGVNPLPVEESLTDDKDIAWAVRRICMNC